MGFDNDYAQMDLDRLSKFYDFRRVSIGSFFRSFLLRILKFCPVVGERLCVLLWKMIISRCGAFDVIISDDNKVNLLSLKNNFRGNPKKALVFRNTFENRISLEDYPGVKFFSFDRDDCQKYGFKKYNQICSGYDVLSQGDLMQKKIFYQFYFIGRNKGRLSLLKSLDEKLLQYTVNFSIVDKKLLYSVGRIRYSKYVTYATHLEYLKRSAVVVDIVKLGQVGVTMRAVEAMVAKKKLVTNNFSIVEEDFYCEENIFLFKNPENLSVTLLSKFLDVEFKEIEESVLRKYSAENAYKEIIDLGLTCI